MKKDPTHHLAGSTPVSSIMTRHLAVVRDTLHVDRLAHLLLKHKVSCVAVSNASGALVGHVSMIDLIRDQFVNGDTEEEGAASARMQHRVDGALGSGFHLKPTTNTTVRDIMMPFVLRLPETASIEKAAAIMAFEGVHRLVVVSQSNTVVGMVAALDVLRWLGDRHGHALTESAKSQWRSSCEYVTG